MLRTLKWAYGLGVKRERERIASFLQTEVANRQMRAGRGFDMVRDPANKMSETRKHKLAFESNVSNEVADICNSIIQPNQEMHYGPSILFPEDDNKKGR